MSDDWREPNRAWWNERVPIHVASDFYDVPAFLARWAETMAALVAPRGRFHLSEFHPFSWTFGDESLDIEHSYFGRAGQVWEGGGTYADPAAETEHNRTINWDHTLADVVSALIDAGFRIDFLHEHDYTLFPRWPFLERRPDGTYRFPEGRPALCSCTR